MTAPINLVSTNLVVLKVANNQNLFLEQSYKKLFEVRSKLVKTIIPVTKTPIRKQILLATKMTFYWYF